jgi:hypothetical protein
LSDLELCRAEINDLHNRMSIVSNAEHVMVSLDASSPLPAIPAGLLLLQRARQVFAVADRDSNGRLSKKEAKRAISADPDLMVLFGFRRMADFSAWFASVDKDHDGTVSEHELEEWLLRHHMDEERLRAVKTQHDHDDDSHMDGLGFLFSLEARQIQA